ncbi:hypothetical protein ACE1B6_14495 [Aerosakkonemataceae cyanobacterium BLCC-F154]|uniref:Uncharacterized protein n=1 Tax=Floridaenema fluviatile BLCC-F154 TaxID=3153640 RepID=A0ABV4YCB6_9CYAN
MEILFSSFSRLPTMVEFIVYAGFPLSSVLSYIPISDYQNRWLKWELSPLAVRQKAEIY